MAPCFPIVKIKLITLFEEITCYLFVNYVTTEHLVQAFVRKYFWRNFICCIVHKQTASGDRIVIISLCTSTTGSLLSLTSFFRVSASDLVSAFYKASYSATDLTLSWPAGHILPTYKESFQVRWGNSIPFFSMLPSTLKYIYSVEPVRMHFPAKQPCTNDNICKAA
jgi:hypothetical protein